MNFEIKSMIVSLVLMVSCAFFLIYGPAREVKHTYEEKSGIIIAKDVGRVNVGKNGFYTQFSFIVKRPTAVEKVEVGVNSFYSLNANDQYKWTADHVSVKEVSLTESVLNAAAFILMIVSAFGFIVFLLSELIG